jgi:hypothetical protein
MGIPGTIRARKFETSPARVAELVDALDLGSSSDKEWEFESPLSHQKKHQFEKIHI